MRRDNGTSVTLRIHYDLTCIDIASGDFVGKDLTPDESKNIWRDYSELLENMYKNLKNIRIEAKNEAEICLKREIDNFVKKHPGIVYEETI